MKRLLLILLLLPVICFGQTIETPSRDSLGLGQRARAIFRSIRTATGTADAPAYSFEAEDNTGMFLHEPSVVAWSLNGIRRLSLNVCNILTGTMLNLVTPNNSELTGIRFFSKNAGGDDRPAGIFNIPDVPALIFSGNAADPHLLIKPEGTVGIATTTPDATTKLHVEGRARFGGVSGLEGMSVEIFSSEPILRLRHTGGTADTKKWDLRVITSADYEALQFRTVDDADSVFATRLAIKPNGNVLIGKETNDDDGNRLQVAGKSSFSDSVGIATSTPDVGTKLHVVGDVRVDGNHRCLTGAYQHVTVQAAVGASSTISLDSIIGDVPYVAGRLSITVTNGTDLGTADFYLADDAGATEMTDALGKFGVAPDASDVNVYTFGAGASNYRIQNKTAFAIGIIINYSGSK